MGVSKGVVRWERMGTAFPHLFHVSHQNKFEAALKRLVLWVPTHTTFVSTTSLGVSLRAHPVRGELHIQRHANGKSTRIIQNGYS